MLAFMIGSKSSLYGFFIIFKRTPLLLALPASPYARPIYLFSLKGFQHALQPSQY